MAYCAKCGKETREGQIYCEECLSELEDNTFGDLFDSFDQNPELEDTSDNSSEDDFTKILEELQGHQEVNKGIGERERKVDSSPSTVGDFFSDAVSAISSLEDEIENIVDINRLNENPKPQKKGFFARLFKRKEKNKTLVGSSLISFKEDGTTEKKLSKNAIKKLKREKVKQEKEEIELEKKAKAENKKSKKIKSKRAESKKLESKKAEPKREESKKAESKIAEPKRAESKKESSNQETKKKEIKKTDQPEQDIKREKSKQEKLEEIIVKEEDGYFNPFALIVALGAFLIFTIFILVKVYTVPYGNSIETASQKFYNRKYNQAFEEIYGLDIKEDDQQLYDKIITVMYVNKQLNSYNNYMELKMYPEALDSLVKGLKRYDKYIEEALELGIEDDLDYVRGQILKVLKKEFGISEKKAMKLTKIEDQTEYSIKIHDIVIENTDYVIQ